MNLNHTKQTIWLVLALVLGAALTASAAAADRPAGMSQAAFAAQLARDQALNEHYGNAATRMSPAEFRALHLRSVALNQRYGLGDYAQSSSVQTDVVPSARDQALNERYGDAATRMSPVEFRALYLRSVALNQRYGLGDFARSTPPPAATPSSVGDGFDWVDAAIGAAAAIGVLLLAAAAAFSLRGRWHPPVIHGH